MHRTTEAWKLTLAVWFAGVLRSISGHRVCWKGSPDNRLADVRVGTRVAASEEGSGSPSECWGSIPLGLAVFAGSSVVEHGKRRSAWYRRSEVRSLPREPHRGSSVVRAPAVQAGGRRFKSSPLYRADSSVGRAPGGVKASLEVGCSTHPRPTHGSIAQQAEHRLNEPDGREFDPRCSHPCTGIPRRELRRNDPQFGKFDSCPVRRK